MIQRSERQTNILLVMVKDLLDFSRIRVGKSLQKTEPLQRDADNQAGSAGLCLVLFFGRYISTKPVGIIGYQATEYYNAWCELV